MRHHFSLSVPTAAALMLCSVLAGAQSESSPAPAPPAQQPAVRSYHDGSVRDIDAIGNRNIGCQRSMGNWYSIEKQVAMGKQYSTQVETTSKLVKDPEVTEYVNRIGQNLVRNSDALVPFTIKVVDSDEVNAFALPGGFFYVDSGLILAADNEAELAGVMSHEIAHVAACHAARENTRGQLMNLASIPLIMVGGPIGYAGYQAAGLLLPLGFLKFSRGFESEADFLGVEYMYKAGYDPQSFTAFFEKIRNLEKHRPGTISKAFDSHPQTPDRIEKTQNEINTLLPAQAEYKVDTSEFQEVKARLGAIENRHKIDSNHEEGKPTLRRSASPADTAKADENDDDRPTLKRRNDNQQ